MYGEKQQVYDMETLMRTYGNDVLRTAVFYVKDKHTAEDIFQEVFLKVNKNLNGFQGNSSVKTWILRITINTCKDYLKSAWKQRVISVAEYDDSGLVSEDILHQVEREEQNRFVREAVMNLPEKYKDILVCVYFQEKTLSETAYILQIAEGTVKSRLSRAKEKLKNSLEGRI